MMIDDSVQILATTEMFLSAWDNEKHYEICCGQFLTEPQETGHIIPFGNAIILPGTQYVIISCDLGGDLGCYPSSGSH